ncbi:MAG: DUF11 domain-containing protein, partial [Candidatus Falkowbacteria bacterium]|nr:DUF11 domain-containing protein [Candidatus Falkowbacteria bacterium]
QMNVANIMPGDSVTRWIKVTNKTNENITIDTSATGVNDPYNLGDMLNIVITKGSSTLYQNTLSTFFNAGSISLGSLAANENVQYYYTISFNTQAGNDYQDKTLMFDIIIDPPVPETTENENILTASPYGGGSIFFANTSHGASTQSPIVRGEVGAPNLAVNKSIEAPYANPGQKNIPYKVVITNNGNLTAYNVKLQDVLDPGLVFSDDKGNTKTWVIGDLGPGESHDIYYAVDVLDDATYSFHKDIAEVSADNNDPIKVETSLEIKPIRVLGMELSATGFKIAEFILLTSVLIILLLLILGIKIRLLSNIRLNENKRKFLNIVLKSTKT